MTWQSHENNLFLFLLPLVKGKLRGIRFVSKKSNPSFYPSLLKEEIGS
jgi:hypothetical protein